MVPTDHESDDLLVNPAPRCPCVLVLDTSGSMSGDPITELNAGLKQFLQEVEKDETAAWSVELAILTAGGQVDQVLPFTVANQVIVSAEFKANGGTPLGAGVNQALDMLEVRKREYKAAGTSYYQPWLVVITDGEPTDSDVWVRAAKRSRDMAEDGKLVALMVGVTGATEAQLNLASNRPALKLKGVEFTKFFLWLSASMVAVSNSGGPGNKVNLPAMKDWTDTWESI